MSKYSKINFIYFLQKWMDSVPGQTFLNYAYSWGAAVVILGTLFKLTHLPGANFMLFLGMGTEVIVFFISAFDRPFDKTTIDMELDNHMADQVIDNATYSPLGETVQQPSAIQQHPMPQRRPTASSEQQTVAQHQSAHPLSGGNIQGNIGGTDSQGGTVIIGGTGIGTSSASQGGGTVIIGGTGNGSGNGSQGGTVVIGGGTSTGAVAQNTGTAPTGTVVFGKDDTDNTKEPKTSDETASAVATGGSSNVSSPQIITPAPAVSQETAAEMEVVTKAYIERLGELNDMLEKVGQLTSRLSTDSEEMENLNRTLTGIARVYEMQLKSASQQITTQDSINEQTRIMAQKIQELNNIYTRMIEAMTVNMPGGMKNNA